MDNYQIADQFSLLSKLMDIHGDNSFKAKSYASAAFAIEKLIQPLSEISPEKIAGIRGIGSSAAQKITEILQTGKLEALEKLIVETPLGVIEMLKIKGIGPKKIHTIWKEMELESLGELLYACKENRLKLYKGFGEKTQQNVAESIAFYFSQQGNFLYAQIEEVVAALETLLKKEFAENYIQVTGDYKRQLETITELAFIINEPAQHIQEKLNQWQGLQFTEAQSHYVCYSSDAGFKLKIFCAVEQPLLQTMVATSSSPQFLEALQQKGFSFTAASGTDESKLFEANGLPYIPAYAREHAALLTEANAAARLSNVIKPTDIKGLIHCHSNWSDGSNSLEEMALAAIAAGLEYMAISDHSKSAFYAQGLNEERVAAQQQQIDELNKKLAPFKIFKSIESDILNDGSLDYAPEVLKSFDLVIASVHSNLKMTEEKAMMRLIKAIENPYTTILGHPTGRLLLSRPGYPVNHAYIIDACAANNVAIELNANPSRLDIDWRFIKMALDKDVRISINPDSHTADTIHYTKYGVLVAQKALVSPEQNLSSYSLDAFEKFLSAQKR